MNPEQARIQADLRGLVAGDVYCDDLFRQMYSSDASILQVTPAGVVRPKTAADVAAVVRYAAENGLSVHPRGSGSSVVGGSLGTGLILDFSVYMRRIVPGPDGTVRVQAGAVLAEMNRVLAEQDRVFGPDPLTRSVTTLGGVLSMNATGSHWMRYGTPRDKIRRLKVVFADGEIAELGKGAPATPRLKRLAAEVELALQRSGNLIRECWPESPTNQAGYPLTDLFADGQLDLARLICGSEGTLAIITEATLETEPIPRHRGVVLLFFDSLQSAATAGQALLADDVAACDLLDRRLLSFVRSHDERYQDVVPENAEAMLLVEIQAPSGPELRNRVMELESQFQQDRRAIWSRSTCIPDERNFFWRMVRRGITMQFGLKGTQQAISYVDDLGVPAESLPAFIRDVPGILNACDVTASVFAHIGQGVVQIKPQLDLSDSDDRDRLESLADRLFQKVLDCKGTVSAAHGDGLVRTPQLRRQYGKLCDLFAEIKRRFDPTFILNPGRIVEEAQLSVKQHLRKTASPSVVPARDGTEIDEAGDERIQGEAPEDLVGRKRRKRRRSKDRPALEPQLSWELPVMASAASQCNGCARCRTGSSDERMCPIFRLNPREEASPRAKANLMRNILNGNVPATQLDSQSLKEIADLCVNCHQCRFECPAGVDIPGLMMEAKAQHVAVNGLRMSEWLLTRLDVLYRFAGRSPWIVNQLIQNRVSRWVLDRLFGIAQTRKLPHFARRPFLKEAAREKLNQPHRGEGNKVLYFVDAFANWNDVELARAVCAVLKHNNFEVYVPPAQQISGMSMISAGVVDRARKIAARNVEILAEGVRLGYHIVTSEPSAALALKHEYLHLSDDADTRMVSENCTDISNFLWRLHLRGALQLDFQPVMQTVGYHLPCHQRALGHVVAGINLLRLIPGMKVERLEKGCSGMAGMYGLIRSNLRRSLRAGVELISEVRKPGIHVGCTECSTCKIQMEHGRTRKATVHPVKVLAYAYNLMEDELHDLFERKSGALTTSC